MRIPRSEAKPRTEPFESRGSFDMIFDRHFFDRDELFLEKCVESDLGRGSRDERDAFTGQIGNAGELGIRGRQPASAIDEPS